LHILEHHDIEKVSIWRVEVALLTCLLLAYKSNILYFEISLN